MEFFSFSYFILAVFLTYHMVSGFGIEYYEYFFSYASNFYYFLIYFVFLGIDLMAARSER